MKLTNFPGQNTTIASEFRDGEPLRAVKYYDEHGTVLCCWELTLAERFKLLFTGIIWHTMITHKYPLYKHILSVEKPTEPVPRYSD